MTLGKVIDEHRLVVCVGTGGVGKTTIAAAIAVGAALRGRHAMVLTIDPARQLARALGLAAFTGSGEQVAVEVWQDAHLNPTGSLAAAMLDQKGAWDAFIRRHAPSDSVRDAILGNPFYREMSTSFAGSTEYVAIEELCRLDESGQYDLIVLDTPPAGDAIDFLRAPARIDRLLDPEVANWLTSPYATIGRKAWRAATGGVRFVLRRLERATSAQTLREMSEFFRAFEGLFDDIARRSKRARALLGSSSTAFALITGPREDTRAETEALVRGMQDHGVQLGAIVVNRVHPFPGGHDLINAPLDEVLAEIPDRDVAGWLQRTYALACSISRAERKRLDTMQSKLRPGIGHAEIPELPHDTHSLNDLVVIADSLW